MEVGKLNNENLIKAIADAKKLGVMDDSGAMLINDFLKVIETEIRNKRNQVNQLAGEIAAMGRMADLWSSLIRSHNKTEEEMKKAQEEAMQRRQESELPVAAETEEDLKGEALKVIKKKKKAEEVKANGVA